jgi:hypothetical protein
MENRKFVKILFFVVFGFLFLSTERSFAYEIDTHAFLTKTAVEFYSQKAASSTIQEISDYLIDGARKEDDVPRWMNHFYDPVYDRGLSADPKIDPFYVFGNWNKSKDWSMTSDRQNEMKYKVPTVVASILTAIQQRKISTLTTETDFTWNEAIYFWINGEKEKSMFALGHVLHLIQDSSVPDHTRNDPHPEGSIYERWAGQFTLNNPDNKLLPKLVNKNLISLDNLGSYFDELARYSNNNFYSKDTIGIQSGYDLPEPDFTNYKTKFGLYYVINKDLNNEEYFLIAKKSLTNIVTSAKSNIILDDGIIKESYWNILSPKAVQYSASVMDFFFKEAERLKDDPQFAKRESFFAQVVDVAKDVISVIADTAKDIFSAAQDAAQTQDPNLLASVPLSENINANQPSEQEMIGPSLVDQSVENNDAVMTVINPSDESNMAEPTEEITEIVSKQDTKPEIDEKSVQLAQEQLPNVSEVGGVQGRIGQVSGAVAQTCSFQTSKLPSHQKLLINEVAWMGSLKSANDEWIELRNISGSELDISNWQVLDKEEQIKVAFPENTKVSAGGFLFLERTDDNSAPNVRADIVYTGALSNSNEALRLFDDKCDLVDEVFANSEWPAGETGTKRTMERQADLSWWTYNGGGEGGGDVRILGTPKKENMVKVVSYGGGAAPAAPVIQQLIINEQQPDLAKILISEVQISPISNRFIELYNPNDSAVDLTNWYLQRKTQAGDSFGSLVSKTYFEGKSIAAHGYFLISREALPGADIVLAGLTLTESNSIKFKNSNGDVVDKIGWGEAGDCEGTCTVAVPDGKSIQRKIQNNNFIDTDNNAGDFEIQNCPSPKSQTRSCQTSENSNQAPSAFFDLSLSQPKINEEIIFDAASSTDPDGNIALYEWNFGDGTMASSTQATTTHSYVLDGTYKIDLIVYDNENATSTVSNSVTVGGSSSKPSRVENFLAQYDKPNKKIDLSWDESTDHSGATTTLIYKITDISEVPLLGILMVASSTTATTSVSELGRDYIFSIEAIDEEGLSSDIATTTVSAPSVSLEDVNYLLLNKTETSGAMSSSDRIFKPLATGVIDSIAFNIGVSYNQNIPGISSNVDVSLYEWDNDDQSKGALVAKSGVETVYTHTSSLTLYFSSENKAVLDSGKFYYFEINILNSSGISINWRPYIVIKAVSTGIIGISSPASNYVYGDTNVDFSFKYLEPFSNKYNAIVVETRDFYTDAIIDNYRVDLEAGQKIIGWHNLATTTRVLPPGFYKTKTTLVCPDPCESNVIEDESNFSVFGAPPAEGKLLDQIDRPASLSGSQFSGQVFRPLVSGKIDSLSLYIASVTGSQSSARSNVFWNIYEWNGDGNSLAGSQGGLLATTTPKEIVAGGDFSGQQTWDLDGANEIYLDSGKYYFLTLSVVPLNPEILLLPQLNTYMSHNGSLIDGRLVAQYIDQGDLYLIINKKAEASGL